jgi:hypothetical protein
MQNIAVCQPVVYMPSPERSTLQLVCLLAVSVPLDAFVLSMLVITFIATVGSPNHLYFCSLTGSFAHGAVALADALKEILSKYMIIVEWEVSPVLGLVLNIHELGDALGCVIDPSLVNSGTQRGDAVRMGTLSSTAGRVNPRLGHFSLKHTPSQRNSILRHHLCPYFISCSYRDAQSGKTTIGP